MQRPARKAAHAAQTTVDLVALPAGVHRFGNEGQAEGATSEHHEFGVALLDLAAPDLQQARNVERVLAGFLGREHAQHQHLECHHIHFKLGDLVAKPRLLIHALCLGNALEALKFALGTVDVGNVGALMAEQVFGVSPALVFFADQVIGGHLHVVKPDLVDLGLAVEQHDGAHGHARGLHVDQQKGNAGLRFAFGAGAHQAKNPVAVLAQRGPGLLAVDDVVIALALGLAFDGGQVRAGTRLAVALAPPDLATGNAGQKALLLLGVAKGHDDRRHHHRPEGHHARRAGQGAFFFKQMLLHRVPARAAEGLGPAVAQPAFLAQNPGPALQVVFGQTQRVMHLVRDVGGQIRQDPGAYVFAKLLFFGGES